MNTNRIITLLSIGALLTLDLSQAQGQTFTFEKAAGNGSAGTNNGISSAEFNYPSGIAFDASGTGYVADQANNSIRKMVAHGTNWLVTTIAGGTRGSQDGTGSVAQFSAPTDLVIDSSSNIYVSDQFNYTLREISPSGTNWIVSTIAGQVGVSGISNGIGTNAQFFNPTGLAMDASGNIYVADEFNNAIREVSPAGGSNWVVSTVAGGTQGSADGTNEGAQFFKPSGVAVDSSGRLFVADQFNNEIRMITPSGSNWVVTTIAGQLIAGFRNGVGTNALFQAPVSVNVDTNGNVFVSDLFNDAIRELTPSGPNWNVSTVAGGSQGTSNGTGSSVQFYLPNGLAFDSYGDLFVTDSGNNEIREGVSSTAPSMVGSLTVTITPSGAVTGGAEWNLDGGAFMASGTTVSNVAAGNHVVAFNNVSGFTTPADQLPAVTAFQTMSLTANYTAGITNEGSLQVLIYPWSAWLNGAEWQVDGGAAQTNGAIVAGLSVGQHTISFTTVSGFGTPASQTITITNEETTLGIGTYTPNSVGSYSLIVDAYPTNEGTVSGSGTYPGGSIQSVSATPNSGFEFIGWAGQGTGTNNPLSVNVYTNLHVTAYFAPVGSMTLTVITNGSGTVSPNWNGKTLVRNRTYRLDAVAKSGNLFSNWTGSITTNKDPLAVKIQSSMVLQANFVPNPFIPAEGIYNGLFMTTNGAAEETAGMLNHLVIGQKGNYSGALLINGTRRGISGTFNLAGEATNRINRPASQGGNLVASLKLYGGAVPPVIFGTVTGPTWVANLMADRGTNSVPSAEYDMTMAPDTNNAPPTSSPGGYSYAAITNNAARNATAATTRITGNLADGTAITETVPVSADGYVPVYVNLYGGKGMLFGWINLTGSNTLGTGLTWIHPQRPFGLYQAGFTNLVFSNQLVISRWSNAPAIFGTLTNLIVSPTPTLTNQLVSYPISIGENGKITGDDITGTLNLHTGVFQVTIGKGADAVRGNGAIVLASTNGAGYTLTKTSAQALQISH